MSKAIVNLRYYSISALTSLTFFKARTGLADEMIRATCF